MRALTLDELTMEEMVHIHETDMMKPEEHYPPKSVHDDYLVDTTKSIENRSMKEMDVELDKNGEIDGNDASTYPFQF